MTMLKQSIRAFALALVLTGMVAGSASAKSGYNSDLNQPSYWGNACVKTDMNGEVMTFTAPAGATKVIVKGGTENAVYTAGPFADLTAPINERSGKPYAISHVIVCNDIVAAPVAPVKPGTPVKALTPAQPVASADNRPVAAVVTPVQVSNGAGKELVAPLSITPSHLPETGLSGLVAALWTLALGATTFVIGRIVRTQ